jgi:hypothetical protein
VKFIVVWGRSANTHIFLQNGDLINFHFRKEIKPKDIQIYLHLSTKLQRCKGELFLAVDEGKLSNSCSTHTSPKKRAHWYTQDRMLCGAYSVNGHSNKERKPCSWWD